MLMRLGARVPIVSKWAPYYYFRHEATAAFLLEQGMDPARRGQSALVELLLEHGADPVAAGTSWAVPRAWAERKGHGHVADMLRQADAEHGLGT
jgi:hypothetical protein